MTPEQLAARWLADCASDAREVYADTCKTAIEAIDYMEQLALAAIARHLAPGDDLGLIERLQARDKSRHGYYGHPLYNRDGPEAAARLSALTAERDEARAERDKWEAAWNDENDAWHQVLLRAEAAEAENARLRDRLARMEGALRFYAEGEWPEDYPGGVLYAAGEDTPEFKTHIDYGHLARAALTETPADGGIE